MSAKQTNHTLFDVPPKSQDTADEFSSIPRTKWGLVCFVCLLEIALRFKNEQSLFTVYMLYVMQLTGSACRLAIQKFL